MTTTLTHDEMVDAVLDFARTYPTRNVGRMVQAAADGRITWEDAYRIAQEALAAGIAAAACGCWNYTALGHCIHTARIAQEALAAGIAAAACGCWNYTALGHCIHTA